MAKYITDFDDLFFNLFDYLKAQDYASGMEEADLKEVIREFDKFLGAEADPCRALGDEEGVKLIDGQVKAPASFQSPKKSYYENGWFALGYSEDLGGIPTPSMINVACTSLYCGANVALSMYTELSRSALNVILKVGTQEQKEKYFEKMFQGDWGGTMCLTEPGAGSDVGAVKTTATPSEGNSYLIKGNKIFISSGDSDLYDNIVHLVLARTPEAASGTKGLSLFIVPKIEIKSDGTLGDSNNVKVGKIEEKMGIHGSATCELVFGSAGETKGYLLGEEFQGMTNMFIMMNEARILCGIQGEGQGNIVYQFAAQYAEERTQFGSSINKLPDVNRMLTKMRAMGRGMRGLSLYTARLLDEEAKGNHELAQELGLMTPVCKAFCSEEGFNLSVDAIQIHGGYGYCSEYGIEQFARDTKIATIYEGTNAIQALDFVQRKILKDEAKTFLRVISRIQENIENAHQKAPEWKSEVELIGQSIDDAGIILRGFGAWVKDRPENIMYHAYDFLIFCGNLFTSSILLEHAMLAKSQLESASNSEQKVFLESKIEDFKVYAQHYLTRNLGVRQRICDFPTTIHRV